MDQAPALVDPGMVEQPFDRPRAAPRDAIGDLLHLLGGVDMHRAVRGQREQRREFIGRHGAKRMRRDADIGIAGKLGPRCIEQHRKAVDVAQETPLPRARRSGTKIAVRIENGEQRQADARRRARLRNRARHFRPIGVSCACRVMVQIMKFADAREPRFEHFGISLRSYRGDILWRQPVEKAVHDLAPAPEIVVGPAAALRKPRHAALEAVAVDVTQAGKRDTMPFVSGLRRNACLNRCNPAVGDAQPHVLCPATFDPCTFEPESHHLSSSYYV